MSSVHSRIDGCWTLKALRLYAFWKMPPSWTFIIVVLLQMPPRIVCYYYRTQLAANISRTLDNLLQQYDKNLRPGFGGECKRTVLSWEDGKEEEGSGAKVVVIRCYPRNLIMPSHQINILAEAYSISFWTGVFKSYEINDDTCLIFHVVLNICD